MRQCFMMQPFDHGKFDKRYDDVFKPAIEAAGLTPYRVDDDPSVEIPIQAIEEQIRNSVACVAEITTNNPNVWYELGYAFALGKTVVMACSDEREGNRLPFDIQHRTIIRYKTESTQDLKLLESNITTRLTALLEKKEQLEAIGSQSLLSDVAGLSQYELIVLAAAANNAAANDGTADLSQVKRDVEKYGFNGLAFNLGLRKLVKKQFVRLTDVVELENPNWRQSGYNEPTVIVVEELGWQWIDSNEDKFAMRDPWDGTIPF